MIEKIKVKAAPGLKCPMEGRPRRHITDSAPVEVRPTPYYRRLIADGSLVRVQEKPERKPAPAAAVPKAEDQTKKKEDGKK